MSNNTPFFLLQDDNLNMNSKEPGGVTLRNCLAIIVRKEGCQGDPGDFWMYESGYLLFQVSTEVLERYF